MRPTGMGRGPVPVFMCGALDEASGWGYSEGEGNRLAQRRTVMKTKVIGLLVLLMLLLLPTFLTAGEPARATWGIDYQQTGQSPYVGPHEGIKLL